MRLSCKALKTLATHVATFMDLEIIILSEISQTEKDKHHMILFICGIETYMNELTYKTEIDSHRKRTYSYQTG